MALSIPRKKKLIRIIIIVASLVSSDLENDIDDTPIEGILEDLACANEVLFSVEDWQPEHEEAWLAVEDIYNAISPEATSDPYWENLSDNLGAKLAQL